MQVDWIQLGTEHFIPADVQEELINSSSEALYDMLLNGVCASSAPLLCRICNTVNQLSVFSHLQYKPSEWEYSVGVITATFSRGNNCVA